MKLHNTCEPKIIHHLQISPGALSEYCSRNMMQNVSLTLEDCSRFCFELLKILSVFSFAFSPGFSLLQPFYLGHILSSSFWIFVTNDQLFLFSLFSFLFLFINRISFRTVSEDSCVSPFSPSKVLFSRRCLRMRHDFFRVENFFCDHIRLTLFQLLFCQSYFSSMFVAQVPKFSQGDQTLYDLVAAIYGSSVGETIEELLYCLYSSPAFYPVVQ